MPATILTNDFSVAQLFLGGQQFKNGTYTNGSGSTVTLVAGQLFGRILATDLVAPCIAASTDGSEMPRYLLADAYSVPAGESVTVSLCWAGNVNKNMVTLNSTDTWATTVRTVSTGGGKLEDLFVANTDINLIASTELTNYDNS